MIPSEIGLLHDSLIVLKLAQNKLKQLTLSTRELTKLEVLGLAENSLTELPEGMELLVSLKELHLSGNALVRFNVCVGRMPKLTKLSLDWFSFLVPTMPSLQTRISNFEIDQVMREYYAANGGHLNNSFHQRHPQNLQDSFERFSPTRQQQVDDQPQAPKSGLVRLRQSPKLLDVKPVVIDCSNTDDEEGLLLIASERNNQRTRTGCGCEL